MVTNVETDANAVTNLKAVIEGEVVGLTEPEILAFSFVRFSVRQHIPLRRKISNADANVDFAKVKFSLLIVIVVQIADVPADVASVKGETCVNIVLVGINVASPVVNI